MKKVLSILLVIAMAATLFAGCGTEPTPTPSETGNPSASVETSPTTTEPTKDPKTSWTSSWKAGDDLKEIVVYDADNYMTRWNVGAKIKMAEYGLKLGTTISRVCADQTNVGSYTLLSSSDGRETYLTELAMMFSEGENKPDVLPAIYASNVATGAAFKVKSVYKNLVNLTPFLEEGGALDNYVSYVWGQEYGDVGYWETAKEALAVDGAIYALPRVEMLSAKYQIMWNRDALTELNISTPKTLADLESALESWVAEGHNGFAFNPNDVSIESILTPIANMYGLDFSTGFDWKEKNGEPIFSYYFPEYLEVLETVNRWAKKGLVCTSATDGTKIAMSGDLKTDDNMKSQDDAKAYATGALCLYGGTETGSYLTAKYDASATWTETVVSASGYEGAITAGSAFDYLYFAIGNASVTDETEAGYETVLRIMNYFNDTMTHDAYIEYCMGKQGIPFAETFEESGRWVYVEYEGEQYIRWIGKDDRYWMNSQDDTLDMYKAGRKFYRTVHPLFTWLFDVCNSFANGDGDLRGDWGFNTNYTEDDIIFDAVNNNYNEIFDITQDSWVTPGESTVEGVPADKSEWEYYAGLATSEYGIKDFMYEYTGKEKLWNVADGGNFYRWGTDWHADITGFPMQYTIYFMNESQSNNYPNKDIVLEATGKDGTNTQIMAGFFPEPSEVLSGAAASDMNLKISTLSKIAKQFTIDYLTGNKGKNDWSAYVKSLDEAGIQDVYEFYSEYAYTFNTVKKDGVRSMSSVLN